MEPGYALISGMTRTGSTLLDKLLGSHPEIEVLSQPFPLLSVEVMREFQRRLGRGSVYHSLGTLVDERDYAPDDLYDFLDSYVIESDILATWLDEMAHYSGQLTRFPDSDRLARESAPGTLTKVTAGLLRAAARDSDAAVLGAKDVLIEELLPHYVANGFHAIITIRDPRDVLASMTFGNRSEDWVGSPRPMLFNVRNWRKSVMVAAHLASSDRFRLVRYEDVVADTASSLDDLALFVGTAPFPDGHFDGEIEDRSGAVWHGNSSYNARSGVTSASIGRFSNSLEPDVVRYIETLCFAEMAWLGYETSEIDEPDPAVLSSFEEPIPINRNEFGAGYSTSEANLAMERARLKALSSRDVTERGAYFRYPGVFETLQGAVDRARVR